MLETLAAPGTAAAADGAAAWADVMAVCGRIPPLWDLHNYVAVNPFLGFTAAAPDEAARVIGDGLDAQVLPATAFYRERWAAAAFGPAELSAAARRLGREPDELGAVLAGHRPPPTRAACPVETFAERHDRLHGTDWHDQLTRAVARWCAVHVSGGGTYWARPVQGGSLYASWLEAARVDRSLEIAGLRGWRAWAARLPGRHDAAILTLLPRLEVPPERLREYLYRLLGGLYGWASYLRRSSWEEGTEEPGAAAELLAVRLCCDAAVADLGRPIGRPWPSEASRLAEDESVRLAFQEALEDGFVRRLLGKLPPPPGRRTTHRPALQAVFCIDVRSEPMRRHLEAQAPGVETLGFAGFFGVALDWHADGCASARCPVLLRPGARLRAPAAPRAKLARKALKHAQGAPGASFSFVETLGLGYAARLAADALGIVPTRPADGRGPLGLGPGRPGEGIDAQARLDLAAGILKHMGLRAPLARLVLLCGHEAQTANNPHAAGLDCGACGGHGGALNARVAAALLNDPAVREGLSGRGWQVPPDTHFLPAVHNTSTDEVTLLDAGQVPAGHKRELDEVRGWLRAAGALVRRERAAALSLGARPAGLLDRLFRSRARDWSEVRPEWGLARNAAFIAARRERTRAVDLQGRAFLHEYDAAADPDDAVLTLILTAPVVVASWINLQYFASTVDNGVFGCGTKALHNRVGSAGVVLGNGGDLRTGLPAQSVHGPDGRWFHEPLRLQVVVEARPERIDRVLTAQPGVRELVDNGWVRLFALDPEGPGASLRLAGGVWEPVPAVP